MLGINTPREKISPAFSKKIRAALWRGLTGHLNKEEREARRKEREACKRIKISWE